LVRLASYKKIFLTIKSVAFFGQRNGQTVPWLRGIVSAWPAGSLVRIPPECKVL
jgi:hypothetical protein